MSNFKSGSGNLDFGGDSADEAEEETPDKKDSQAPRTKPKTAPTEQSPMESQEDQPTESGSSTKTSSPEPNSTEQSQVNSPSERYPYFIRRSNVGDERDTRLEIHVRDKVADQEANFRSALADQLGTNEISKTDAREFALLAAFNNPEKVAELMEDEGFGTL